MLEQEQNGAEQDVNLDELLEAKIGALKLKDPEITAKALADKTGAGFHKVKKVLRSFNLSESEFF